MDATHTRSTDFTADGDMMTVVLQQTDSTPEHGRRDQRRVRVACSSCASFMIFPSLLLLSSCDGRGQQQKQRTAPIRAAPLHLQHLLFFCWRQAKGIPGIRRQLKAEAEWLRQRLQS